MATSGDEKAHDPMGSLKDRLPELPFNRHTIRDSITSQLGRYNPFARPIEPESTIVWLFDNTAYQTSHGGWTCDYVAAYFVRRSGAEASMIVSSLAQAIGLADDVEAKQTIAHRLGPLLDQILPAKIASINIGGLVKHTLVPSDSDGISKEMVRMPGNDWRDGQTIETSVEGGAEFIRSTTTFAEQEGFAVVSDIDDTIKVTLTNSALGILKTTFAEEPKVIEGMPELYQHLSKTFGKPPFWYLSASPYNLYAFLRDFRNKHYPQGTMLLRDASWMNLAGFIGSMSQDTQGYKVQNLDEIHKGWPRRKIICIGDSTQSDPEAYAEAFRKYPGWIKAIWIRKARDVVEIKDVLPGQSSEKRNSPERFEKAFEDVPQAVWHVFESPQELYAKVDALHR